MMLLIHVQIRHQRKLYKQNGRNAVFEFLVHHLMVLKSQLHILAEWCERKRGHLEIRPFKRLFQGSRHRTAARGEESV